MDEKNTSVTGDTTPTKPAVTVTTTTPSAHTETTTATPVIEEAPKSRFPIKSVIAFLIGLAIAVGSYFGYQEYEKRGPVAIVNDFKIARSEFNKSVELIKQNASLQGADLTNPEVLSEIDKQAIDLLVSNALLLSGAEAAGITATDEDVQAKYDELVTELGGAEVLATRLAEAGITDAELRDNIRERVIVDAYLDANTELNKVTITDAEVKAAYDSYKESGVEIPAYEDVAELIRGQLLGERQQAIVNEFIESLRAEASVEIKI